MTWPGFFLSLLLSFCRYPSFSRKILFAVGVGLATAVFVFLLYRYLNQHIPRFQAQLFIFFHIGAPKFFHIRS